MGHRGANLICAMLCSAALCAAFLSACGELHDNGGEDYGDIAAQPSGTTLTQEHHRAGWGIASCFDCHNVANIHQTDRTGTGINLGAIQKMTEEEGLSSCVLCHGTNGVD